MDPSRKKILTIAYRGIFFTGYFLVLLASVLNVGGNLSKVHVDMMAFKLRLDHLLHLLIYFTVSMYFLAGRYFDLSLFGRQPLTRFFSLIIFLATVTEVVQIWVPFRSFSVLDWLSNMTGIILGFAVIRLASVFKKATNGSGHA